ncbi:hypothetical protein MMC28_006976 [Mycoblastus sanguinarius]|nr:hypothetical protein [Mycoblastus sanguinarius]
MLNLVGPFKPQAMASRLQFIDEAASYFEEPPETPAHLFAVRAFKTALFGTPHPDCRDARRPAQQQDQVAGQHVKQDKAEAAIVSIQDLKPTKDTEDTDGLAHELESSVKFDPMLSPTRGILLTPGTGATRRKTVSFGNLTANLQRKEDETSTAHGGLELRSITAANDKGSEAPARIQPRQSSLTKTLIELSKQKVYESAAPDGPVVPAPPNAPVPGNDIKKEPLEPVTDNTVDLSQPLSRSGQHWKAEYEQYHKRSNREMKKIIKYGQNVKSYAVKKDSEATNLGEKLKKELDKVATMEAKVSKLATQLRNAQTQGPDGETDQTRLVSELAQQTALAIRYKQKADKYSRAMRKQGSKATLKDDQDDSKIVESAIEGHLRQGSSLDETDKSRELVQLRSELDSLRINAKAAEDQVVKLEVENTALKRSLARVKEEMMSYESRRQAREESLKKREAKHKAARTECENQLSQLKLEHQELLRKSAQPIQAKVEPQDLPFPSQTLSGGLVKERIPPGVAPVQGGSQDLQTVRGDVQAPEPYISPRKKRLQKTAVDIWTLSSPRNGTDDAPRTKEHTELAPSSVKHDIHRTLKEIDQNLIPEQSPTVKPAADGDHPLATTSPEVPAPKVSHSTMPLAVRRMHTRRATISSPRPSMINLQSSPAKLEPLQPTNDPHSKPSVATTGRSSSLMSRVGSRASTMGSTKGMMLPAERAAAAKARLARRSAEKKKRQENEAPMRE